MPELFVHLFEGRTLDQKRLLVRSLTEATCASLGVPAETVTVQLIESARASRSRGGVLFCDRPDPAPAASSARSTEAS